jgi:hypothetical protein
VVPPRFETRNPQDHGERKTWRCAADGAQDSGLGGAFGQPLASEAEAGSAEQRKEKPDNSCEDSHLLIDLCERVHQLLVVLFNRLNGDDRARTTALPCRNGGARDRNVLGQASGTGPDHVVAKPVVVRAARS